MLCPLVESWAMLVALRAVIGLALSGIAAAATAYISEEVAPVVAGWSLDTSSLVTRWEGCPGVLCQPADRPYLNKHHFLWFCDQPDFGCFAG